MTITEPLLALWFCGAGAALGVVLLTYSLIVSLRKRIKRRKP